MYISLDKASNSKDSKFEKSKPKTQKPKALNSNNSLCLDLRVNVKTFDKAWKKKKKY